MGLKVLLCFFFGWLRYQMFHDSLWIGNMRCSKLFTSSAIANTDSLKYFINHVSFWFLFCLFKNLVLLSGSIYVICTSREFCKWVERVNILWFLPFIPLHIRKKCNSWLVWQWIAYLCSTPIPPPYINCLGAVAETISFICHHRQHFACNVFFATLQIIENSLFNI